MKILDLANYIWTSELDEPTDPSAASIIYWLTNNIGVLNNLTANNFSIESDEAVPEMLDSEAAIFGLMYLSKYYARKAKGVLGAGGYWLSIKDGDSEITQVNKNEMSKTYLGLKRDYDSELNRLAVLYKTNKSIPASMYNDYFSSVIYNKTLEQPLENFPIDVAGS